MRPGRDILLVRRVKNSVEGCVVDGHQRLMKRCSRRELPVSKSDG